MLQIIEVYAFRVVFGNELNESVLFYFFRGGDGVFILFFL